MLTAAVQEVPATELTEGGNLSLLIRLDATEKQIASLAARFGMSPADRARMGDDPPASSPKSTHFADMLAKAAAISADSPPRAAGRPPL